MTWLYLIGAHCCFSRQLHNGYIFVLVQNRLCLAKSLVDQLATHSVSNEDIEGSNPPPPLLGSTNTSFKVPYLHACPIRVFC